MRVDTPHPLNLPTKSEFLRKTVPSPAKKRSPDRVNDRGFGAVKRCSRKRTIQLSITRQFHKKSKSQEKVACGKLRPRKFPMTEFKQDVRHHCRNIRCRSNCRRQYRRRNGHSVAAAVMISSTAAGALSVSANCRQDPRTARRAARPNAETPTGSSDTCMDGLDCQRWAMVAKTSSDPLKS